MTWRKTGTEFDDECANVDLSDAAYRTHLEGIGFVYRIEADSCMFAKSAVRRFATSTDADRAIQELIDHGFWKDRGSRYEVVHHGDVIRESLHAQQGKRDRDRAAKQRQRAKQSEQEQAADVSGEVSADSRQTDRQTDKQLESDQTLTCKHEFKPGAWVSPLKQESGCTACQAGRVSA